MVLEQPKIASDGLTSVLYKIRYAYDTYPAMTPATTRRKILYIITKSNWGGAQRYVYDLATHLDHTQFEPVVALGGDGELADMLRHAGVRVITLTKLQNTTSPTLAWQATRELYQLLRQERPHVIHLNSSVAGFLGALAGRLARVPKIFFTAHGWAFNEDRPEWQRFIFKVLHYLTVLLTHRTIAVSHAIVRDLAWPGVERKMKIVHPGRTIGPMYNKDEAREKLTNFLPALAPHHSATWLGIIAELHPIKRHHILFEAMARLVQEFPKVRLVVIGDGQLRNTLEAQIATYSLTEHIFMAGHVSEAARFLKAFDIFVLPSKSESYGYVIHEAGLAQVAVVASDVGGIPDIVRHRQSGILVPPDNPQELVLALRELLRDPQLRKTYATALKTDLEGRTLNQMANAIMDLYRL